MNCVILVNKVFSQSIWDFDESMIAESVRWIGIRVWISSGRIPLGCCDPHDIGEAVIGIQNCSVDNNCCNVAVAVASGAAENDDRNVFATSTVSCFQVWL